MAAERLADPLAHDAAAAEGDRAAVGPLEQVADDLRLAAPELLLALALEGVGDRLAELAFHQLVGLGRLQPPAAGGGQGGRSCRRP